MYSMSTKPSTPNEIIKACSPFTMTSDERKHQTIKSIQYIVENQIIGDIIEIGVWRGGTVMIMLYQLMAMGVVDRHVHLYDTFQGMTEATDFDVDMHGNKAKDIFNSVKCEASFEDVFKNISSVGYPMEYVHFHKGDIRQVNIVDIPKQIAVLRLDNDWYELYKFELPIFEPLVVSKGMVTIDDYNHWNGCKKAVDEYLATIDKVELHIIDNTGVYWVKL